MKTVLLNGSILGLNNEKLVDYTGRYIMDENGNQVPETNEIKFGKLALDAIIRMGSENDEQALMLFGLAEKLNENLKLAEPTEMELSQEEFEIVKRVIDNQPVIVKARFLQMVTPIP